MQPTLTGLARVLTRNPKVRVEMSSTDNGSTDGTRIFFRPPIELGDRTPHNRRLCDKRDEDDQLLCKACSIRESVTVTMLHEFGHIVFDSFEPATDEAIVEGLKLAIAEHGTKFAKQLERAIQSLAHPGYLQLMALIGYYHKLLQNAFEDARIESKTFDNRPGARVMFKANIAKIFRDGVPQPDKTVKHWREYPLNTQAVFVMYLKTAGYEWTQHVHEKVARDLEVDPVLDAICAKVRRARSVESTFSLAFEAMARLREMGYLLNENERQDLEEEQKDEDADSGGDDQEQQESSNSSDDADDDSESGSSDGSDGDDSDSEPEDAEGDGEQDEADPSSSDGSADADPSEDTGDAEGDDDDSRSDSDEDGEPGSAGDEASDTDPGSGVDEDEPGEDATGSEEEAGEGSGEGEEEPESDSSGESDGSGDDPDADGTEEDEGSGSTAPGGDEDHSDEPEPDGEDGSEADDASAEDGGEEARTGQRSGAGEPSHDAPFDDDLPEEESEFGDPDNGDEVEESASERSEQAETAPEAEGGAGGSLAEESKADDPHLVDLDDDERIDTGADDGEGGTQLEGEEEMPEWGDEDDAKTALYKLLDHEEKPKTMQAQREEQAVDKAIIQGMYFETPSRNIYGVREHFWDRPIMGTDSAGNVVNYSRAWNENEWLGFGGFQSGKDGDFDIEESILGPALMEMRVAFADNRRGRTTVNQKSGHVNGRALGKRAWSGDERLFKKNSKPGKRDYFVCIMMDISGSTIGENLYIMKIAVHAQAQLLSRMGIKFAIYAQSGYFHDEGERRLEGLDLDIYVVKEPNEPWDSNIRHRLEQLGPDAFNLDGHAMEYARKVCDRSTATDKVILYYSDGKMPAENYDEELDILQRELRTLQKRRVTVLGVGIRTDSPRRHGLETVQLDTVEDTGQVVKQLRQQILRTAR